MIETLCHGLEHQAWRLTNMVELALRGTYTRAILDTFAELVAQLWYFVIIGALISTLIWRFLPRLWLQQQLRRWARGSIVAATLLGLVSPMCTFAAIPIVGVLVGMGVPAPPLIAFMFSSPLMNPTLFVYTAGVIGMEMAIARALAAMSVGLVAGFAAHAIVNRGLLRLDQEALNSMPAELFPAVSGGRDVSAPEQLRLLGRRFLRDLSFIGRYFALGIFIAALTRAFLSEELIVRLVGPGSSWAVPAAVAMGVPLYACGGGSLPVIDSMMQMGMTSGAALAFFIAGPATKFSTVSMLGAVFGRRMLALYLLIMLTAAAAWGYAFPFENQLLIPAGGRDRALGELIAP